MLPLSWGDIFGVCWSNHMFRLFSRNIFELNWLIKFDRLFGVSGGHLSVFKRLNAMFGVPRWILLCHHGSFITGFMHSRLLLNN